MKNSEISNEYLSLVKENVDSLKQDFESHLLERDQQIRYLLDYQGNIMLKDLQIKNPEIFLNKEQRTNFILESRNESIIQKTLSNEMKTIQQPLFFSQEDKNNFEVFSNILFNLMDKIYILYKNNKTIRDLFHLDQLTEEFVLVEQDYSVNFPIARLDIFFTSESEFKLCEINADASSGRLRDKTLAKYLYSTQVISDLKRKYILESYSIIDNLVEECLRIYSKYVELHSAPVLPNVLLLDPLETNESEETNLILNAFRNYGLNTFIVNQYSLSELYFIDDKIYFKGNEINLVFKDIVNEKLILNYANSEKLLIALKNDMVCLVGNIKSEIFDNKILFSVLHNHLLQEFLTESEKEFIIKYIPYSFNCEMDNLVLKNEVLSNKDRFVMKAIDSFQSKGIYIGKKCSRRDWDIIVNECWNERYIVQEFIPTMLDSFIFFENEERLGGLLNDEFRTVIGLFFYNQKFSGIYSRASRDLMVTGSEKDYFIGSIFYKPIV